MRSRSLISIAFASFILLTPYHSARPIDPSEESKTEDTISKEEKQKEIKEFQTLLKRFRERTKEFREEIESVVKLEYERIKKEITTKYEKELLNIEKIERKKRDDAIIYFERFLKKYPNTRYTPMAMLRLAELYYEKEQDNFNLAMDERRVLEEKLEKKEIKELPPEPKKNLLKSIDLYEEIISSYPYFEYIDAAHYMAGICYSEHGDLEIPTERFDRFPWFSNYINMREEEVKAGLPETSPFEKKAQQDQTIEVKKKIPRNDASLFYFKRIIDHFPQSRFVPECYWRIAEYYFQGVTTNDLEKAIEIYKIILSKDIKTLLDKALYKLAWTYYRLNRFQNAIDNFIKLIDLQNEKFKGRDVRIGEFDLREEAKEYIAISFTEWEEKGGIDNAILYFQKLKGRDYAYEILKRIADIYYIQERWNLAIDSYKKVVDLYPESPDGPSMYERIVKAYFSNNDPDSANEAKATIARKFGENSRWAKVNRGNREAITNAKNLIQNSLRDSGIFFHKKAQSTHEREDYLVAAQYYKDYLNQFPYAPDAFEINFNYAECLFYSGRYEEAVTQYKKVMKYPEKDYFTHAAEGILYAYENLIKEREGGMGPPPSTPSEELDKVAPIPISPLKKEFIDACDRFPEWHPKSDKIPVFLYKAAEIFFTHNHFDEARKRFMKIIETYPATDVAAHSAGLYVDTYTLEKDWNNVKKFSSLFSSMGLGGSDEIKTQKIATFKTMEAGAHFKLGENLELENKYEEAANVFLEYTRLYPDSPHRELALYNAGANFENAKLIDEMIASYERFTQEYPNSKHLKTVLFRLALNYENLLDFRKAIDKYLEIHYKFPGDPEAADALYNGAFLIDGLGEYERSGEYFIRYATLYPEKSDAEYLFFLGARAYEKAGNLEKSRALYQRYISLYPFTNADRVLEAHCRIARIYEKKGKKKDMLKEYSELERKYQVFAKEGNPTLTPVGIKFEGEARFNILKKDLEKYLSIKLSGTERQMQSAFKRKEKLRARLEDAYMELIKIGDFEWASAALHSIGEIYENFSKCVFDSPVPKGLNQEEAAIYKAGLEEQFGFPLENKAVGFYKSNIEKAYQFKENNRWIRASRERLASLRRKEFPPEKGFPLYLAVSSIQLNRSFISTIKDIEKSNEKLESSGKEDLSIKDEVKQ